jgi:hypothetical protein
MTIYKTEMDLTTDLLALAYKAAEGRTLGKPSKHASSCDR